MNAFELAQELKVIINQCQEDKMLSRLFNHSLSQLEYLSEVDSFLIREYEKNKILPLLKK